MSPRNRSAASAPGRSWQTFPHFARKHQQLVLVASLILTLVGAAGVFTFSLSTPKAHAQGGTGATLPYVELEAHSATTNGTMLGPSYALGALASDAVDRQAVQLTQGQYVQFTLPQQANSMNLRYSIPDSSSGGGINASLSVYLNGVKQANDLQLTSRYSWVYGPPNFSNCNATDWSNTPSGTPRSGAPFSRLGYRSMSARNAWSKMSNRVGSSMCALRGFVQPTRSATAIWSPLLPDARWPHPSFLFTAEHPAPATDSIVLTVRHFWTGPGFTPQPATSALASN